MKQVLATSVARGLLHTSAHTEPDLSRLMFHRTEENWVNENRIVTAVLWLSIVLGIPGEMSLRAQAPCPDPPDYQVLRQDEDYSYLRDPGCKRYRWDSLKYVRLGSRSDSYLTIGGEARQW